MNARLMGWSVGVVAGIVAASIVDEGRFPGVRLLVFMGLAGGLGLTAELLHALTGSGEQVLEVTPRPERSPADGRVEIVPIPGVRRGALSQDDRFGRFLAIEGAAARSRRPTDSATPPLLGRVLICSLYVGLDGKPWDDDEVARSHQALLRAGVWVENEAARWSAPVNVEFADTYFAADVDEAGEVLVGFVPEGDDVGPFEEAAGFKAMVMATRAAVRMGFQDFPTLAAAVEERADADAVVWLLHLRRAGRSFAPGVEEVLVPGLKVAVCYCREESFPEPLSGPARTDPVTVVHEMLHLFGATDKYGRPLGSYERNAVSHREVMRLSESRLSRLRVDLETAREVGWASEAEKKPTPAGNLDGRGGRRDL